MIRALIFDFDGLILDTETPVIEAWASLHAEAGMPYATEMASKIVGHVDVPFDPWVAFGPTADRVTLEQEHKRRSRAILSRKAILPGVQECLHAAKDRGLRLGIASNSNHLWVDSHLQRLGLYSFFYAIKCRDDVARGKPEPDVYQAALKDLGVEPGEAIAFEDSSPGSLAAKRAGLRCVAIPNPSTLQHEFTHVDLRLASMSELDLDDLMTRWR